MKRFIHGPFTLQQERVGYTLYLDTPTYADRITLTNDEMDRLAELMTRFTHDQKD